jgi:hypothetical protein
VSLTVTDDDDATATTSQSVLVSASADITLGVTAYKVKGVKYADLAWSPTKDGTVDISRNGNPLLRRPTTAPTPTGLNSKGGGSATYKVCEAGTTTCSNEVTVTW